MYNKNNGKTESEILQNEFTSYFQTAIRNYKKKRLEKETVRDRHIIITDEPGQYRQQKETNIFEQSAYLKVERYHLRRVGKLTKEMIN